MYTTATFARLDQNVDGSARMIFIYTGDAGETPREFAYPFSSATPPSADMMRGLAMDRLAILNQTKNFIAGALPFVGTVLDTTTPLPPPAASTFGFFMAASAPFTPGVTPQDVFTITGSATRVVHVTRMALMTVQTSAGMNAWALVKRSTANSGGTSVLVTAVPADDAFPAATATVRQYTANPTAGALIGNVWSGRVAAPAPASAVTDSEVSPLTDRISPITLSGTADVLAWNFGGVALPAGLSVQASVWWTEN
jgi:hypothetical protein